MTGFRTIDGGGRAKPGFHARALVVVEAGKEPERIETAPYGIMAQPCPMPKRRRPAPPQRDVAISISPGAGRVAITLTHDKKELVRWIDCDEAIDFCAEVFLAVQEARPGAAQ